MSTVVAICLAYASWAVSAKADPVGAATLVEVTALRAPPAATWVELPLAGGVYADDRVQSAPDGGLRVTFLDASELTLGPGATAVIDRFVYAPESRAGSLVAELGTGLFRFTTGSIAPDAVTLRTPTATLGVRGTVFDIVVDRDGRTAVRVESGVVVLQAIAGAFVELGPDEAAFIDSIGDLNIDVIEAEVLRELEAAFDLNLGAIDQATRGLQSDIFTAWDRIAVLEDEVALEEALTQLAGEFVDTNDLDAIVGDLEGEVDRVIEDGEAALDGIANDLLGIGGQLGLQ